MNRANEKAAGKGRFTGAGENGCRRAGVGGMPLARMGKGRSPLRLSRSTASRRGFVLSVEALMAAMLLFSTLLLASALLQPVRAPAGPHLERWAQGLLRLGAENNTWMRAGDFASAGRNDTDARALVESLPAGVCAQVETYNGLLQPARLTWSYTRRACAKRADTPAVSRVGMIWTDAPDASRPYDQYWVRVITYAREGG